jgi:hypothetical protein
MAKKRPDPKKSRLKRFGKWSDSHRADILEEVGLTEQQFRALTRGQRRNTLDRGLALDRQSKDPAATAAPQSIEQIRAAAGNAGQLRYGTAQAELGRYGQNIDPWFQDYVTRTQQIQGQQQQMAAPVIQQAQTNAQQAGQPVLNADPNSEAAQNDILAAASRKALADAFTSVLSGQQNATNTYYANQAGAVEAARVGEHRTQAQGMQDLLRERGAFESDYVTEGRDKEHTKGLERQAFGLDVAKAKLDARADRQRLRQDRREDRQRQRDKDEDQDLQRDKFSSEKEKDAYQKAHGLGPYKKSSPGGSRVTPAEKRARRKERREAEQRRDTIVELYKTAKDPKTGKSPDRETIISGLIQKGYTRAEIMKALAEMRGKIKRPAHAPSNSGQQRPT